MRAAAVLWALLGLALCRPVLAQWSKPEETVSEKMQRGIGLYEKGEDDEAMDIFMDVLVSGDPSEKALANDYMNRINRRMSEGEQRLSAPSLPQASTLAPRKTAEQPAVLPEHVAAPETERLSKGDRADLMTQEIDVKIAAMRKDVVDKLRLMKEVRVELSGQLPEGLGLSTEALFVSDVRFKLPDADRILGVVAGLLYADGSAQAIIVPEGYVVNEAKVLDMRRAMAVRSYFTERGLSPARVRLALVGNDVSVPASVSDYRGMLIVFQYDRPLRLGAEGVVDETAGPPVSLGVWPPAIKATKDEGAIIEFSVMDPPQGVSSWKFQMLMPTVEGSQVVASLQEVVGDSPVLHQIYWNGRRNYFGELLPFGRYQLVLTARNLRGKETVMRQEILLEREATPVAAKNPIAVVQIGKGEDADEDEDTEDQVKAPAPAPVTRKAKRHLRSSPLAIASSAPAAAPAKKKAAAPVAETPAAETTAPAAASGASAAAGDAAKAAPAKEPVAVGGIANFPVYFEPNSVNILNEKVLQQVPANLSNYPLANLSLVGYAYKGENDAASLAEKRAQVVSDLLVQKYHVDKAKILTQTQVADDENEKVEIYVSQPN